MPVYQCYAVQSPVYGPAMRLLSAITNATVPQATTTFAHGYVDGTVVRFDFPPAVGMQQLNQLTSAILVTGPTTFTFTIDTTNFAPFAIPGGTSPFIDICAQCVPIGSRNDTLKPAEVNIL